jgi:3'-phosphoadenosine 5'-phosphosulfate (PAPS) 3'-phosphatase
MECLEPFNHTEEPAEEHQIRVAASLSHFNERMQSIIETIKPVDIVRLGGAGNKCFHVSLNTVDCYMHPSPGLKYWDLCANESLIKGMGGFATDLYENRMTYPLDGDRKVKGLILARNPPMYNMIKRRLGPLLATIVQTVKL